MTLDRDHHDDAGSPVAATRTRRSAFQPLKPCQHCRWIPQEVEARSVRYPILVAMSHAVSPTHSTNRLTQNHGAGTTTPARSLPTRSGVQAWACSATRVVPDREIIG